MMSDFLANNRGELIQRCRTKVAQRPLRHATAEQLREGVPTFLDQLIKTLRIEQSSDSTDSREISGLSSGVPSLSEIGQSAAHHGRTLLALGFSVDQVVHDYGDLCQAITDLAFERDAPFLVDEFRTLNRCLDNAIADAVTEFSYQRDLALRGEKRVEVNERLVSLHTNCAICWEPRIWQVRLLKPEVSAFLAQREVFWSEVWSPLRG
jgi:hypothetical protein